MSKDYYTAMFIDGLEVKSSAVCNGPLTKCEKVAKNLNRRKDKHKSVEWKVCKCL